MQLSGEVGVFVTDRGTWSRQPTHQAAMKAFRYALRQDQRRWSRERRAEVYVDLSRTPGGRGSGVVEVAGRHQQMSCGTVFIGADRDEVVTFAVPGPNRQATLNRKLVALLVGF
jgi:hypothetical protein